MGIRESALNTITALTNSDFVRMVTAAGASRKASLQSVAQHIIESYAGSTLAGRQQSVKSAIDELNSTSVSITAGTGVTIPQNNSVRNGKLVAINAYFQCDSVTAGTAITVGTVDENSRPASETTVVGYDNFSRAVCTGWMNTGGVIKLVPPTTATSRSLRVSFCYKAK